MAKQIIGYQPIYIKCLRLHITVVNAWLLYCKWEAGKIIFHSWSFLLICICSKITATHVRFQGYQVY